MKKFFKTIVLALLTLLIGSTFNSCERESFDQENQEIIASQENKLVEVSINGQLLLVEEFEDKYRLDDMLFMKGPSAKGYATASVGLAGNRWPNNTVTYVLDPSLSASDVNVALESMKHWELFTNINFVERPYTGNIADLRGALLILRGNTCFSGVGYFGANTEHVLSIGSGCRVEETIHELGHAVGLWHEHSRPDRDQYITVNWNNIATSDEYNFQINANSQEYSAFDFNSVMLYESYALSSNGFPTITRKNGSTFDYRDEYLSYLDIQGLKTMYPQIGANKIITIKRGNEYVSSENGADITIDRPDPGSWEEFEVVPYGDGYVYLKGNNNKYLSENTNGYLRFDKNTTATATKFRLEASGGFHGLKSEKSGSYIVQEYTSSKLIAAGDYLNGEAAFIIEIIKGETINTNGIVPGSTITLEGNNGKFVSSENGSKPMNCDRPNGNGSWEKFEVVDAGAGLIALKGNNGKFVSSENGSKPMNCDRPSDGSWEKFELIDLGNGKHALKGSNNKYISSENGNTSMTCNRVSITATEQFTITVL